MSLRKEILEKNKARVAAVASKVLKNIGKVLGRKNYALIAIITSVVSAILLYYLMVFNVAFKSLSIFIEMNGLAFTYISIVSIAAIAILFGINTSLLAFKLKRMKKAGSKRGIAGIFGGVVGAFASGCPTCGSVVFAVLIGNPLTLFYLPFWGLELKALSIILLAISIFMLASRIDEKACKKCK
ncbi:MAG: hypothetical protein J4478_02055 [Candidatus Diapherotrites archaeon]|uniref:Uncharacterized protein n=1 Tax=Candidatus Iainarchaeum sp. TaxID=3101447 RepID=A0A7J4JVQ0_9ARCH|nr:MAG: hypothetical protein QT12_C0034G0004 [archaeon GW2011_AR21]MBS3058162.1 hypothetical protein [Candidatus Diapherotrites archaeon]HIH21544.1 hypothetical protein [Candidatus Diapherotrites archaeon]